MFFALPQTPAPPPPTGAVYRVPYRLTDTKHIIVRVKLNGKGPFAFILDTGSPAFIISEIVGKKAGAIPADEPWSTIKNVDIEGGLSRNDVKVRVWDPFQLKHMNEAGLADADIAGVLGFNLIGRYRMDIDFKRRHMLWTDTGVEPVSPAPGEVTGGRPIKPADAIGDLDEIASTARRYMPRKKLQTVRGRGFIGMTLADGEGGVRVLTVVPGSPAAKAGLQANDRILKATLGGEAEKVETAEALVDLASSLAPGRRLFLQAGRGERKFKVAVMAERAVL